MGLRVKFGGGAIERLAGGGSSRYCCGGGMGDVPRDGLFERREGFLLGIGGGAGLRRTWGWVFEAR